MYFSDITNEELQPFHGLKIPNINISLTDILDSDLFRIENITSNIYRIYPLFYTDKITSSNPNDQILENKCIICQEQTTETYFTFISNEDEPIEDYIKYGTYFDIGDSLSVSGFNEIVFLLRENHTHNDEILLKQGSVQGQYGEYVFDIESTTIVDKGILITNETLTNLGTVTLTNPLFSNSDYTLKLKVSYMTDVNVCDDVSEDNIVVDTLSIPLVDGVTETIPFDTLDYNYIIGFDAVVEITHTKPVINGVWVDDVDLSVDETTVDVGDTITLTATVKDNHGDSVSGVTVTFKNGATTLGTASTNSSGVATYNYTTTATGVLSLTATANSLVSDVVEVTVEGVVPSSISLISDKPILSYADGDSATLTATYVGGSVEGLTVVFKAYKGGTLVEDIGSDTTDSSGVASVSYSSKGAGDLSIQCECMNLQETYEVQDCTDYQAMTDNSKQSRWTIPSSITSSSIFGYSSDGWKIGNASSYSHMYLEETFSTPTSIEFQLNDYNSATESPFIRICDTNKANFQAMFTVLNSNITFAGTNLSRNAVKGAVYRIEIYSNQMKLYENDILISTVSVTPHSSFMLVNTTGTSRMMQWKDLKIKPL